MLPATAILLLATNLQYTIGIARLGSYTVSVKFSLPFDFLFTFYVFAQNQLKAVTYFEAKFAIGKIVFFYSS